MITSYFRLHLVRKRWILCHRVASIWRLDPNNLLRSNSFDKRKICMCISKAGKINHTVICQGHPHSCIKCYGYIQIIIQIYLQITSISGSPRFQTQARGYASSRNLVNQEIPPDKVSYFGSRSLNLFQLTLFHPGRGRSALTPRKRVSP